MNRFAVSALFIFLFLYFCEWSEAHGHKNLQAYHIPHFCLSHDEFINDVVVVEMIHQRYLNFVVNISNDMWNNRDVTF